MVSAARTSKKSHRTPIFAFMAVFPFGCARLAVILSLAVHLLAAPAAAGTATETCAGDCNVDWQVGVDELVQGVGIVLGRGSLDRCPALDADGDDGIGLEELVSAVDRSLHGCGEAPTPTATETPTATPTGTPAEEGPEIVFFGVTLSDDTLLDPEPTSGPPIFHLPFGSGFSLVVEAVAKGPCSCSTTGCECIGRRTFDPSDGPDLQIQVTRPLGNASPAVCDVDEENAGGVPPIDPPRFDDSPDAIGIFNDLGCRFVDGNGASQARACTEQACIRSEEAEYGCRSERARLQFCGPVSAATLFPDGDTLVTARVRDVDGVWGPIAQLIIRIAPLSAAR
jgi:hypothetical protein